MYLQDVALTTSDAKSIAIVGVNSDPTADFLRSVMKDKDLPWTSFFDGGGTGGPIATKWGVRGWPTVFIIDHKGIIRKKGRADLDGLIETLVREAEAAK